MDSRAAVVERRLRSLMETGKRENEHRIAAGIVLLLASHRFNLGVQRTTQIADR